MVRLMSIVIYEDEATHLNDLAQIRVVKGMSTDLRNSQGL
jgi:hypothetical protein